MPVWPYRFVAFSRPARSPATSPSRSTWSALGSWRTSTGRRRRLRFGRPRPISSRHSSALRALKSTCTSTSSPVTMIEFSIDPAAATPREPTLGTRAAATRATAVLTVRRSGPRDDRRVPDVPAGAHPALADHDRHRAAVPGLGEALLDLGGKRRIGRQQLLQPALERNPRLLVGRVGGDVIR